MVKSFYQTYSEERGSRCPLGENVSRRLTKGVTERSGEQDDVLWEIVSDLDKVLT